MKTEELPEPALDHLVMQLATSAAIELGEIANPITGETNVSLSRARFSIGLLEVLQKKTSGNLSAAEQQLIERALHGIRLAWLRHSNDGA